MDYNLEGNKLEYKMEENNLEEYKMVVNNNQVDYKMVEYNHKRGLVYKWYHTPNRIRMLKKGNKR